MSQTLIWWEHWHGALSWFPVGTESTPNSLQFTIVHNSVHSYRIFTLNEILYGQLATGWKTQKVFAKLIWGASKLKPQSHQWHVTNVAQSIRLLNVNPLMPTSNFRCTPSFWLKRSLVFFALIMFISTEGEARPNFEGKSSTMENMHAGSARSDSRFCRQGNEAPWLGQVTLRPEKWILGKQSAPKNYGYIEKELKIFVYIKKSRESFVRYWRICGPTLDKNRNFRKGATAWSSSGIT